MTTEKAKTPLAVRIFKAIGIACVLLVSLLILVWVHENWSGAREWKRVETKLIDAGVELDPKKLIGEATPAEENFGAHPLVVSLSKFQTGEDGEHVYDNPEAVEEIRKLVVPQDTNQSDYQPNWETRSAPDFATLANDLDLPGEDLEDVIAWIRKYQPTLAELDQAARRPEAVLPFEMGETFVEQISAHLPFLTDFMNLARFQAVRACAELEAGNDEEARKALHTLMQVGGVAGSHPSLVGHLVGVTCENFALSAIWYGLKEDLWSEENLRWVKTRLEEEPEMMIARLERAINFELCVFIIGGMDFFKAVNSGQEQEALGELLGTGPQGRFTYSLIPNGIWDHNKAFAAEWIYDSGLEPLRRGEVGDEKSEAELGRELRLGSFPAPRRFMASMLVPQTSGIAKRSFSAAMVTEFARISCALELYYKSVGSYPEVLSSLVPEFLAKVPEDRFSPDDNRIQYRREGDRYLLYSVGQNRTDEGGEVIFWNSSNERVDRNKGDLVWSYTDFEDLPEGE